MPAAIMRNAHPIFKPNVSTINTPTILACGIHYQNAQGLVLDSTKIVHYQPILHQAKPYLHFSGACIIVTLHMAQSNSQAWHLTVIHLTDFLSMSELPGQKTPPDALYREYLLRRKVLRCNAVINDIDNSLHSLQWEDTTRYTPYSRGSKCTDVLSWEAVQTIV